ncbi:small ovary isoform 2-T4 [Cochliomyia hominivorax]
MTETQYEAKFRDMQKYVPFIQRVIDRLKVNNEHMADNPRKAQLEKMEKLHDLLTNKVKNIKVETLEKCEGVIKRLQNKLEMQNTASLKNDDSILNNVQLKKSTALTGASNSTSSSKPAKNSPTEDISGPASPPPEIIEDVLVQPVVIPTERRCSPILLKEKAKQFKSANDSHKSSKTSVNTKDLHFQQLRDKTFHVPPGKSVENAPHHTSHSHQSRTQIHQLQHSHQHHQQHHSKRPNTPLPKEKPSEVPQTLQTVKVVITEPLPVHVKQQHFPSSSKYLPRSSICHNNLKTLPQLSPGGISNKSEDNNDAYSPEELWEQYNESHNKPVFQRLGAKVPETQQLISETITKPSGRYTPIPDVLKSPPLSANDISNLLLETGADKNDISAIGTRRPTKPDSEVANNSFEVIRKKLAHSVRMNSPVIEIPKQQEDKDERISVASNKLPQERIALKYNPHPRQERLQSISSTESSECSSIQTKINDPRLKLKVTSSPITQHPPSNVNILPTINLNDPRLKKQQFSPLIIASPSPSLSPSTITLPPGQTSTPTIPYHQQTPQNSLNFGNRIDPRLARQPQNINNRRPSISQPPHPQYSSEEDWDADVQERTKKASARAGEHMKTENRFENQPRSSTPGPAFKRRNSFCHSRFPLDTKADKIPLTCGNSLEFEKFNNNKSCPPLNQNLNKTENNENSKKCKKKFNKMEPSTPLIVPNPPKSDTEEDWDSEPEQAVNKLKTIVPPTNAFEKSNGPPANSFDKTNVPPPLVAFHNYNSPQTYLSPVHNIGAIPAPFKIHNPLPQYPALGGGGGGVGIQHNSNFPLTHPKNNRFNYSPLNDNKPERTKYCDTVKPKPRGDDFSSYKEYREAKQRALAQEAALKRAADEAEAKRRAEAFKETQKEKEKLEEPQTSATDKRTPAKDVNKKVEVLKTRQKETLNKNKEKDKNVSVSAESSLDKMYRTQNFCTQFPKSNTSFKIPKKKTEEKPKEVEIENNNTKTTEEEKSLSLSNNESDSLNHHEENKEKSEELATDLNKDKQTNNRDPRCRAKDNKQSIQQEQTKKDKEGIKEQEQEQEKHKEKVSENDKELREDKVPENDKEQNKEVQKDTAKETRENNKQDDKNKPEEKAKETQKDNSKENAKQTTVYDDIVINSGEKEFTIKPQQQKQLTALDKFNKLTEDLNPKPQRILRRRNTMLVFDSAPLVDKEKLKKANAMLFEDIQEEEKRKRKQEEEEKLVARRNKHLEEMFKKTDDNCTVSTQNIITGKRRTRTTINFNETVNAINIFKHKTMKDTSLNSSSTNTITPAQLTKSVKTNFKIKLTKIDLKEKIIKETKDTTGSQKESKIIKNNKKEETDEEESEKEEFEKPRPKSAKAKYLKNKQKRKETEDVDAVEAGKDSKQTKGKSLRGNKKQNDVEKSKAEETNKKGKQIKTKKRITKNQEDEVTTDESEEYDEPETSKIQQKRGKTKSNKKQQEESTEPTEEEEEQEKVETNKIVKQTKTKKVNKRKAKKTNKSTTETENSDVETNEEESEEDTTTLANLKAGKERTKSKPSITKKVAKNEIDEQEACTFSPISTDQPAEKLTTKTPSCSTFNSNKTSLKKEIDDNESSSNTSKSLNATPTPEANVAILNEIVDKILEPSSDREHVLSVLGQILSEERLEFIKSVIENHQKQNEEQNVPEKIQNENENEILNNKTKEIKQENITDNKDKHKTKQVINQNEKEARNVEMEMEDIEEKPLISLNVSNEEVGGGGLGKKISSLNKKKRSELDRLNDDIRDMFICEGVLTATGRRMCTIMGGKEVEAEKKSPTTEQNNKNKINVSNKPRRSLRTLKNQEDNNEEEDDNQSLNAKTSENSSGQDTERSLSTESSPQRKMPVLKPHTPIRIPEEIDRENRKSKEANKRKLDNKLTPKNKKAKLIQKVESETEEHVSEDEADEEEEKSLEDTATVNNNLSKGLKNNNVHWHNQSKYTTWCMICEKRLIAKSSSAHYKSHHAENYLSRMAPVLLQQFKQNKLNKPLFGVKKIKQNSWFFRCPFCLKYFNTPVTLWLEHFLNHTTEFRYECSKCHYGNNRRLTVIRHLKSCEGSTLLTSAVKLQKNGEINAHICHLCNFLQLKRPNLERHYIEQHQMDKKTVELLGYTITIFNVENVECVTEDKAAEKEKEAWKVIESNEQIIDIEDEEDLDSSKNHEVENEKNNIEQIKRDQETPEINDKKSADTIKDVEQNVTESVQEKCDAIEGRDKEPHGTEISKLDTTRKDKIETEVAEKTKEKPLLIISNEKLSKSNKDSNLEIENQQISNENEKEKINKEVKSGITHQENELNLNKEQSEENAKVQENQKNQTEIDLNQVKEKVNVPTQSKDVEPKKNSNQTKHEDSSYSKDTGLELNKDSSTKTIDLKKNESIESKEHEDVNKDQKINKIQTSQITSDTSETEETLTLMYNSDCELISELETQQNIQDELLNLAAKMVETENEPSREERKEENESSRKEKILNQESSRNERIQEELLNLSEQVTENEKQQEKVLESQTSMSDIISNSIDLIYKRGISNKRRSISQETDALESKKLCQTPINVFMTTTREENSNSPTIQILAQSIINIEDTEQGCINNIDKPITMAERLSQRLKEMKSSPTPATPPPTPKENVVENLINDTLLELEKEKDKTKPRISEIPNTSASTSSKDETSIIKEIRDKNEINKQQKLKEKLDNNEESSKPCIPEVITVISDDEDWEDIEITETTPTLATSSTGNTTKNKKHLTPLAFIPKKKNKSLINANVTNTKTNVSNTSNTCTIPTTNTTTTTTTTTTSSSNSTATANLLSNNRSATNSPFANLRHHLGFKPVINIMEDLLPDSPCNDPIDLVPELAPLEPLQDLNDISSILDSNLSAVNINANHNHTSIEEALDFVNEQQEQQHQHQQNTNSNSSNSNSNSLPTKSVLNIFHVGFSQQETTNGNSSLKFYCLLENCSFLFSSDAIGLETHFMLEHSQIKWNGYCYICQSQCCPESKGREELSITKEIKHMMEKHANKSNLDINNSDSNSCGQIVTQEERPKIKLRRLTGDCLSRATPEIVDSNVNEVQSKATKNSSMLGALLVAKPKPPTIDMPPQPLMPLTEPLLLDNNATVTPAMTLNSIKEDFVITAVTSAQSITKQSPLQISSVISLKRPLNDPVVAEASAQLPKISNVRTLSAKTGNLWSQRIENESLELKEAAAESLEVSSILASAKTPTRIESRNEDDSPVIVAETVPIAQNKTGDFVITQTLSAQYNNSSSAALGFNINIAAFSPTTAEKTSALITSANTTTTTTSSAPTPPISTLTSRQYKCMAAGCKFVTRVPVAMSEHLRFHERRNFSNKRDYLACGFCFNTATDVEDYMKHAEQYHIIGKTGAPPPGLSVSAAGTNEIDTATSLTKKIQHILNSTNSNNNNSSSSSRCSSSSLTPQIPNQTPITPQVPDTEEVYLEKLRNTIDEIVGPTGLADNKLYRCVIKSCQTQLNESTFLNHILYHINTTGHNPNHYIYKCPHCTSQYNRPAGIKAHIKNHGRNRYFCYLCEHTSTNPGQLLKHFSEKHWHTLSMYTKELLKPKISSDGSNSVIDSGYYIVYTQDLNDEEVRKFGEKLILDWQRKKSGSKTHFKSSEIDLLPMTAIFTRDINCGECAYKTKVRTNMFRHLQMHKQYAGLGNKSDATKVYSVDPVNPVPCLNSSERFFDKMTNLASSSLIPSSSTSTSSSSGTAGSTNKANLKIPYSYVQDSKRFTCGCGSCNYHTISEELFRSHLTTLHSNTSTYRCPFCQEEICKRGITVDRIINHLRFHGACIFRCDECFYVHHLRYVVERHINEKHATMKVNIVKHERSTEDNAEGTVTVVAFAGKKYKETLETNKPSQTSIPATRSTNNDGTATKHNTSSNTTTAKVKGKWVCDVCGHKAGSVAQIQNHCQQQHSVKNQYKCAHCNFGSQQLSQILTHIDEKHSGMAREARTMYYKEESAKEKLADTRPLWQRNDPTRVRHIRGILMEDEEESEEYRKKLALTEGEEEEENEGDGDEGEEMEIEIEVEEDEENNQTNYLIGYEFGCYHCDYKAQTFEVLKEQHYKTQHNSKVETAKPFWYRLLRKFCCPECREFVGIHAELQEHLMKIHFKQRFYAADITMMENTDNTSRLVCGYCAVHCANAEDLLRHQLRLQHTAQDIRIDNNQQIADILALTTPVVSYQCTLCTEIFSNRVAIVQHACNVHAGEESFSFRELSNTLMYRCYTCNFTTTKEIDLMRHMIDHYSRFLCCQFCREPQNSFNNYMQHCYAQHKNVIHKFKSIYPIIELRKFLLQMQIIFPSGLVVNKKNLLNTKYGKTDVIDELYEEMYKISQQPPIPRISIARLVARKSIETQHKHMDTTNNTQDEQPKPISKRRRTLVVTLEENKSASFTPAPPIQKSIVKRRTTVDQHEPQVTANFNAPLQMAKITKRRRTVAVDRDTLFSTNLTSNTNNSLLIPTRKQKSSSATNSPKHFNNDTTGYPLNLDIEPFSFYGQKPENLDLSKIHTKVTIGGIKTPLTIDKFKLLFNIECQLKLTKCDDETQIEMMKYNNYKHIKKACPASHKLKYN